MESSRITLNSSTNNALIQIKIKGWKLVQSLLTNKINIYQQDNEIFLSVNGTFTVNGSGETLLTTIPSSYCPLTGYRIVPCQHDYQSLLLLKSDGSLIYRAIGTTETSRPINTTLNYPI